MNRRTKHEGGGCRLPQSGERKTRYESREFWDERYANDPVLGSGIGSRGEWARRKGEVIGRDVGCGDRAIFDGIDLARNLRYVGINVSQVITERNKTLWPQYTFIAGSCCEVLGMGISGDLVLCLDVLIHEPNERGFRDSIRDLREATRSTLVVSGYEAPPSGPFASEITFYHIPLSQVLFELGSFHPIPLLDYRATTLWRIDMNRP